MSTDMTALIDRLGEEAVRCRTLIRQMHEAQQDLAGVIREARAAMAELRQTVADTVDEQVEAAIGASVKEHVDALGELTRQQMDRASRKIINEFNRLSQPLLESLGLIEANIEVATETQDTTAMALEYELHMTELRDLGIAHGAEEAVAASLEWNASHDWRAYRNAWRAKRRAGEARP